MPPTLPPTPAALTHPSTRTDPNLVEKHPAALRWMHWLNFPLLFLMIWSGLMIYWATSTPGVNASASHDHQVYRIGIGSFTLLRLFPDGFYHFFRIDGHLTRGIAFHAFFMWLFAINGLAYVLFLAFSGQWRNILPTRETLKALPATLRTELSLTHRPPTVPNPVLHPDSLPAAKYNPAQRLAYTAVLLMGTGSLLTGIAIWKPSSLPWITFLCGGYEVARWLHFWLTIAFCAFFLVHVVQVCRSGWNTLRAMLIGVELLLVEEPDPDNEIPANPSLKDPDPAIPASAVPVLTRTILAKQAAGLPMPVLGKRLG